MANGTEYAHNQGAFVAEKWTTIPDSANLNNYKTPGTFYGAAGTSITNRPSNDAFKLVVLEITDTIIVQVAFLASADLVEKRRYWSGTAWGSWTSVVLDSVFPVSLSGGGTGANNAADARTNLGVPVFETGTWTPVLYDNNTELYSVSQQQYTRIGDMVFCTFDFTFTTDTTFSTMIQVRGLPMTLSWGGTVYWGADVTGRGGTTTIQGNINGGRLLLRPNISGTIHSGTRMTGLFIGTY